MKNFKNPFAIGIGVVLVMCGVYWFFRGGELLEIILPVILGIGFIASGLYRSQE